MPVIVIDPDGRNPGGSKFSAPVHSPWHSHGRSLAQRVGIQDYPSAQHQEQSPAEEPYATE
jgi:hypothetical protein